ncbi:AAA family ATPase [Dactylosporangium siamense]|uniref:LuxR family transcriptional regulator n=1 Tax=Dactylosporangium siamense TaxID=685454 RepID=A0A919PSF2_9ACTN|nr:LuxR family transcriptional regulator [Dactylosporangium siamense]GIG49771.1 LuxR family transcriptional regulator [Dactylosporangium siamense]
MKVPAPPGGDLLGRASELRTIDALLAGADPPGPSLLLRGDPGAGKTALLDAACARALTAGARVLRATGAPFEAGIRFSALHQMLYASRDVAGRLPDDQRDALAHVFGRAGARDTDPLVLATAVLALVNEIAAGHPLLLAVDDVQWIDPASATVLGFLARRAGGTHARFLGAGRIGTPCLFDEMRLPEHTVGPLPPPAAGTLLDANHRDLPGVVRRRLLADAAGNPLALLELPGSLTDRQRSGQAALPAFLPLNARLEAAFAAGLAALQEPARVLLLLAALDGEADLSTVRAAARPQADLPDLTPARRAGLITVDEAGGRMVFRHPLIRAAIVQLASADERRRAHVALAEALAASSAGHRGTAPERRARHLADAATGPDETVARALDDVAQSAWGGPSGRRIGAAGAVSALVRASELSDRPGQRSRRLVEAAFLANVTGQLDRVPQLLHDAGQTPDTATGLVFAATAHLLTNGECDVDTAHHLLAKALDDLDAIPGNEGWDAYGVLYALLFVCVYSGRPEPWELLRGALSRFDPRAVSALRLCYDAYADPAGTATPVRSRLASAFEALSSDPAPWQFIPLAYAAIELDELAAYRHLCQQVIDRERDGGIVTVVITGLLMLSVDSIAHGQWDEAEQLATEALDMARADGYHLLEGQIRCRLALIAASRGDGSQARVLTDEVTRWATPRGVGLTQALAWQACGLAALGRRDYEDAYLQTTRIDPAGRPSLGIPGRWLVLDVVDAAVHIGHVGEARMHVTAARQAGLPSVSSRTALLTAGAAALAAPDTDADQLYSTALALPDADQWPFEQARIRLAYGEWLRRTRDTTAARLQLREAFESLNRLGAKPWADRARNELRAAGVVTARAGAVVALTPQERQIATLAATGLTNKQIGERLFLSHRTVGAHLHRLFPKLGITSRAALAGALEALGPDD